MSWEELEIPLKWGVIRGKRLSQRSSSGESVQVLGIHGWLDNCNTFDNLAPYLPVSVDLVVIDLPGHGLSDHLPEQAKYDMLTLALNVRNAMAAYGWNKFILMSHSMAVRMGHFLISLFPEIVEAFIMIDAPIGLLEKFSVEKFKRDSLQFNKIDSHRKELQPYYTEKEIMTRLIESRVYRYNKNPSLDERSAKILMDRAVKAMNDKPGYYVWRHDPRAKIAFNTLQTEEVAVSLVRSVTCPVLFIQAENGLFPKKNGVFPIGVQIFHAIYKDCCKYYENVVISGMHHVHMTDAEEVASYINHFINKVVEIRNHVFISKL